MKKQVTIKVVDSNATPLKAMAIAKANGSIGCKNFVDNVFKIKAFFTNFRNTNTNARLVCVRT